MSLSHFFVFLGYCLHMLPPLHCSLHGHKVEEVLELLSYRKKITGVLVRFWVLMCEYYSFHLCVGFFQVLQLPP